MQYPQHAVICAAGLGSRLGLDIPKCLVPIGKKRVIDYQIELLSAIPDVRVVVGFREEDVIKTVRAIRPDAIFVRNPNFMKTSTIDSLLLATQDLEGPYMILDGDLVIHPGDFNNFLQRCQKEEDLVGVTPSKTDEAVFVDLDKDENYVEGFQRTTRRKYEWCGIAQIVNARLEKSTTWVYQELERYLPLPVCPIQTYEIDTPDDLRRAHRHFPQLGYSMD